MNKPWLNPEVAQFLKDTAFVRNGFRKQHRYYHEDDFNFFQKTLQPDSTVLLIGCNVGELAEALTAKEVFVCELDHSENFSSDLTHLHALKNLSELPDGTRLDYIFLPYTLQMVDDIQQFLEDIHPLLDAGTRVVALQYNFLWSFFIKLAQRLGLKSPMPDLNWLNQGDIHNLFEVTEYEPITGSARCLMPVYAPWISDAINSYLAPLPIFQWCCQKTFTVARARSPLVTAQPSVSIVVPVRNEAGNLEPLLSRLPILSDYCEVIFVEGHSSDDSWNEIQRQMKEHPRRDLFKLSCLQQTGKGKADAVRKGFSVATGEMLIILDADISVQPEDLVHFYNAFARGAAEFLNGSRLVYDMEKQAMQLLNLFFNKVFALLLSWFIGQNIKDTLCGTKVLSRRNYHRIREQFPWLSALDPFGDFELLFGASRLNLKIADVPVRYKERRYGRTNIQRFSNGWELLKMIFVSWKRMK